MSTELAAKSYERLDFYIDQIASDMDNAYGKFVECCRIAVEEEHLTPQEAWGYVYTKLKDHVAKSTLYLWGDKVLPEGSKKATRPKKIPTLESPKQEKEFNTEGMGVIPDDDEPEPSSASSSATGPDGEEVEQEIEQPIYPTREIMIEAIADQTIHKNNLDWSEKCKKQAVEYETIIKDKDKALDELRIKIKGLEARLGTHEYNPTLQQQVESLERTVQNFEGELQSARRALPKPEIIKASELSSNTTTNYVIAKHGRLGDLYTFIQHIGGHADIRFTIVNNIVEHWDPVNFATVVGEEENND